MRIAHIKWLVKYCSEWASFDKKNSIIRFRCAPAPSALFGSLRFFPISLMESYLLLSINARLHSLGSALYCPSSFFSVIRCSGCMYTSIYDDIPVRDVIKILELRIFLAIVERKCSLVKGAPRNTHVIIIHARCTIHNLHTIYRYRYFC